MTVDLPTAPRVAAWLTRDDLETVSRRISDLSPAVWCVLDARRWSAEFESIEPGVRFMFATTAAADEFLALDGPRVFEQAARDVLGHAVPATVGITPTNEPPRASAVGTLARAAPAARALTPRAVAEKAAAPSLLWWRRLLRSGVDVRPNVLLVAGALVSCADTTGRNPGRPVWASQAHLCRLTRLGSRNTVKRALDALVAAGWLAEVEGEEYPDIPELVASRRDAARSGPKRPRVFVLIDPDAQQGWTPMLNTDAQSDMLTG